MIDVVAMTILWILSSVSDLREYQIPNDLGGVAGGVGLPSVYTGDLRNGSRDLLYCGRNPCITAGVWCPRNGSRGYQAFIGGWCNVWDEIMDTDRDRVCASGGIVFFCLYVDKSSFCESNALFFSLCDFRPQKIVL